MKILVVSNVYPPHFIGGYELGCRDVVDRLRRRGHEVRVLTERAGDNPSPGHVERRLVRGGDPRPGDPLLRILGRIVRKEWINQRTFRRSVRSFRPDVIYVWNPLGTSLSLVTLAERAAPAAHYYVSDHWLAEAPWGDPWLQIFFQRKGERHRERWVRRLIRFIAGLLRLTTSWQSPASRLQFTSGFLLEEARAVGRAPNGSTVVHWGIDLASFPFPPERGAGDSPRILFVGQLERHKGVHTAIEALHHLRQSHPEATLDIIGSATDPAYRRDLEERVAERELMTAVSFRGRLPRDTVRRELARFDLLVFPSEWEEPFSLTLLEAMASGLPVVTTLTGGTSEIAEPERNVLSFSPGDARGCARQAGRLLEDESLRRRLRNEARQRVRGAFDLSRMVERIESELTVGAAGDPTPAGSPSADSPPPGGACA